MGSTMDRMTSGAHAAVDKTADMAARAAETLDAKGEQLEDLQVQWLEDGRAYVRDHPTTSLNERIREAGDRLRNRRRLVRERGATLGRTLSGSRHPLGYSGRGAAWDFSWENSHSAKHPHRGRRIVRRTPVIRSLRAP